MVADGHDQDQPQAKRGRASSAQSRRIKKSTTPIVVSGEVSAVSNEAIRNEDDSLQVQAQEQSGVQVEKNTSHTTPAPATPTPVIGFGQDIPAFFGISWPTIMDDVQGEHSS